MVKTWLSTDWQQIWLVVVSAIGVFVAVVVVARTVGLRAFSKMSSFDFAVTVATGSIMASVAATSTSLANGVLALAVLFGCQWAVAQIRRRVPIGSRIVDNRPLLLMWEGQVIADHLDMARVTRDDLRAKLRGADVMRHDQVRAVILETTGDISVLTSDGPFDDEVFEDVRGFDAAVVRSDGSGTRQPGRGA